MSVTSSTLLTEGRTGTQDKTGMRSYGATYRVVTSSTNDGPAIVLAYAINSSPDKIPRLWDKYQIDSDSDNYSFCQQRNVERVEDNKRAWWNVKCTWNPLMSGEQQNDQGTNPLERPVKYRIEHATYTEIIETDKDGNSIVNGAKQEFDEPVEQESSRMILVATKNFATLQEIINLNLSHAMHVNNSAFHGAAARKCLCHPIACSDLITEDSASYYQATFHIEFRDDQWDRKIVNRGMKYLKAGELTNVFAYAEDGTTKVAVNEPMLLDADGAMLAADTTGTIANGGVLNFRVRNEISFNGLGV